MSHLAVYSIILMSVFLALYLPLQRKQLVEAFPKSAALITASLLAGSVCFLVLAGWLAILSSGANASDEALKAPSWSLWIGAPALAIGLSCVLVAAYFQVRSISQQREKHQLRMRETQAELQRLDDELITLGIQLPQDKDQPANGTK